MKKERERDRKKSTERQTDRRTRETYNCRCDTATLHVTDNVSISHKNIHRNNANGCWGNPVIIIMTTTKEYNNNSK